MKLRNRNVGLRQQVQRSHQAEIPIQNSHSHNKCSPVCNKSYSTYSLQHPLHKWHHPWRNKKTSQQNGSSSQYSTYSLQHPLHKWHHPWRNKKTSQQNGSSSQSTIIATITTYKHQETKKMLVFILTRYLKWHRWMNTLPRHSNTWYRSVLCIIITLAYRLYSFWLLIIIIIIIIIIINSHRFD